MPNAAQHMAIGGIASVLTYAAMCHYYSRQPAIGEAMICLGTGALGGIAPDLLEPALHPNHRQFFHSLATGGLLLKTGTTLLGQPETEWTEFAKTLAVSAIVGYLTHLVLDGCTPKGLPVLGA